MADSSSEVPSLDLVQRIAAAIARTDEPSLNTSPFVHKENDICLGIVPLHLRHLYLLLGEVTTSLESQMIHHLFSLSVHDHMAEVEVKLHKVKLLPDWTMVGVPDDGRSAAAMDDGIVVEIVTSGQGKEFRGILDILFGRPRQTN